MAIIKIGRASDNDCVLAIDTVSKHHAVLTTDAKNTTGMIRDAGSSNGTFVNGKRVTGETVVTERDEIRLGVYATSLAQIVAKARKPAPKPNERVLGRAQDCKLRMNYDDVSAHHAVLRRESDGSIVIEDLNSSNGTFVNGQRITSCRLRRGDQVMIARVHRFDWERVFPMQGPTPVPTPDNRTPWGVVAGIGTAVAAAVVALFLILGGGKMDMEAINREYNKSVCFVIAQYGYKVTRLGVPQFDGKTVLLNDQLEIRDSVNTVTATAFFISKDGKLATNLHVAKPWLFKPREQKKIEVYKALMKDQNYGLELKFEGVLDYIAIVVNGLPVTHDNMIECTPWPANGDDTNVDVAIIQTSSRSLPAGVSKIIDINDMDEDLTVGRTVYTIGFPYGSSIGMNSYNELSNQCHDGHINQYRGEYDFGHTAETAGGASGSPILSDKGRLLGVHYQGTISKQGFNQAIKAKYVKRLLEN